MFCPHDMESLFASSENYCVQSAFGGFVGYCFIMAVMKDTAKLCAWVEQCTEYVDGEKLKYPRIARDADCFNARLQRLACAAGDYMNSGVKLGFADAAVVWAKRSEPRDRYEAKLWACIDELEFAHDALVASMAAKDGGADSFGDDEKEVSLYDDIVLKLWDDSKGTIQKNKIPAAIGDALSENPKYRVWFIKEDGKTSELQKIDSLKRTVNRWIKYNPFFRSIRWVDEHKHRRTGLPSLVGSYGYYRYKIKSLRRGH